MDGTEQGIKEVAGEFLERYGKRIWKLKGKYCQQDRKYKQTLFDVKSDTDKLIPILDELWVRVRSNIYDSTGPAAESDAGSVESKGKGKQGEESAPRYPAPFSTPAPTDVEQTPEEEDIAVKFVNKVRKEVHGLPGNVKPRRK